MKLRKLHISDIGKIVTGKTPRTAITDNYGGDIPFLTPSDDLSFKYAPTTTKTLTLQGLHEVKNCLLPPKSICVSCIGSDLGKVVLTTKELVSNQQINSIIPSKEFDADFVYYLMTVVGKELNFLSKTSTAVPIINKSTFSKYEVFVPSLGEQHRIAAILSSLDDKIALNRKINDNLEQQAQALFKSWFVDFEPFQDGEFVDSELGRIPKDLMIDSIQNIPHTIETGRRPKGGVGELSNGIPSIGAEHVKGFGNYDFSKTKFISEEYASTLKVGKVKGYELLIYKDGGKPGYFIPNYSIFGEGYPYDECYLNEHVFKLDFDGNRGYNIFCYFFFQNDYVWNYLNAQGGKAAIPGINRKDIESIQVFTPDNRIVNEYGKQVLPLFKRMLINLNENSKLAILRDTLLPKLMSGELNINDLDN